VTPRSGGEGSTATSRLSRGCEAPAGSLTQPERFRSGGCFTKQYDTVLDGPKPSHGGRDYLSRHGRRSRPSTNCLPQSGFITVDFSCQARSTFHLKIHHEARRSRSSLLCETPCLRGGFWTPSTSRENRIATPRACNWIGGGKGCWPSPPSERTCRSPASGSPVGGLLREDRTSLGWASCRMKSPCLVKEGHLASDCDSAALLRSGRSPRPSCLRARLRRAAVSSRPAWRYVSEVSAFRSISKPPPQRRFRSKMVWEEDVVPKCPLVLAAKACSSPPPPPPPPRPGSCSGQRRPAFEAVAEELDALGAAFRTSRGLSGCRTGRLIAVSCRTPPRARAASFGATPQHNEVSALAHHLPALLPPSEVEGSR